MHPIITNDPGYAAIAADRSQAEEARRKFSLRKAKKDRDYQRALAEHRTTVRNATLLGDEPPPAPQPPTDTADPHLLIQQLEAIDRAEEQWLADNADRLLHALVAREREVLDEVRPAVAELQQVAPELNQAIVSAVRIKKARGDSGARTAGTLTAADVAHAVASGTPPSQRGVPAPQRIIDLGAPGRQPEGRADDAAVSHDRDHSDRSNSFWGGSALRGRR